MSSDPIAVLWNKVVERLNTISGLVVYDEQRTGTKTGVRIPCVQLSAVGGGKLPSGIGEVFGGTTNKGFYLTVRIQMDVRAYSGSACNTWGGSIIDALYSSKTQFEEIGCSRFDYTGPFDMPLEQTEQSQNDFRKTMDWRFFLVFNKSS